MSDGQTHAQTVSPEKTVRAKTELRSHNPGPRQLEDITPQFLPMWNARNEAVTGYVCVPEKLAFKEAASESVVISALTAKERATAELRCIDLGTAKLAELVGREIRFLMIFRIAFEGLAAASARREFTNRCGRLPADLRQYVVFELTEIPAGVPHSRLGDIATAIKPYAKAIVAQVPLHCQSYAAYQGIGLLGLGLNLEQAKLSTKELTDDVNKLCAAAKRLALYSFLSGVSDIAALRVARKASVHFMTGSAIAPPLAAPNGMARLTWALLMKGTA